MTDSGHFFKNDFRLFLSRKQLFAPASRLLTRGFPRTICRGGINYYIYETFWHLSSSLKVTYYDIHCTMTLENSLLDFSKLNKSFVWTFQTF